MDDPFEFLALLMALRVQGIAPAERAAVAAGCASDVAAEQLSSFVERGLAVERTGRVAGFTLTSQGAEHLEELLAKEGLRKSPVLLDCYDRFLGLNTRVLKVSSDWQLRRVDGVETPNDHSDTHYDYEVIGRLEEIHMRARACLEKMCGCGSRLAPYAHRLDDCVKRLRNGDRSAFTAPLAESYHTVWFELHQDLLLTLDLKREG